MPSERWRGFPPRDRGMVTAELAACLPVLVLLVGVGVGVVGVVGAQTQALDAAREAARVAARGEPARARAVAQAVAPGADVSLRTASGWVTATAVLDRRLPVPFLPAVAV